MLNSLSERSKCFLNFLRTRNMWSNCSRNGLGSNRVAEDEFGRKYRAETLLSGKWYSCYALQGGALPRRLIPADGQLRQGNQFPDPICSDRLN